MCNTPVVKYARDANGFAVLLLRPFLAFGLGSLVLVIIEVEASSGKVTIDKVTIDKDCKRPKTEDPSPGN